MQRSAPKTLSKLPAGASKTGRNIDEDLCGAVGIELEVVHPEVEICHCRMCQRWTGAMYGGIAGEHFTLTCEEHIATYQSSDWAERAFCSMCGSNLWHKFLPNSKQDFPRWSARIAARSANQLPNIC